LRTNKLTLWDKNDPQALEIRALGKLKDRSYKTYRSYIEDSNPEVSANTIICLIHQTNYLLDQQIRKLEEQFINEGGIRENMMKARLNNKKIRIN